MGIVSARIFQAAARTGSNLMKWPKPELVECPDSVLQVPDIVKRCGVGKVLVVTGPNLTKRGLPQKLTSALEKAGIPFAYFDDVTENPTIENVEAGYLLYRSEGCQGIIAIGGGSPMDCAKAIGARAARPDRSVADMRGVLKVGRDLPLLIAIPTTAGTGSETTVAAVISNHATHEKYAINDPHLVPRYAVLDPELTVGLPPSITANTGLDALTHAVEAFIGHSNTMETFACAKEATALIFRYLPIAYRDGSDLEARSKMLHASYLAGVAFTRAYVGNVHAIAHTLGAFYDVPHGLACAVVLPYVLDYYGDSASRRLAELAVCAHIANTGDEAADAKVFIAAIRDLEASMDVPEHFDCIRPEDIPSMITNALREANPLYPVPRVFDRSDFQHIYEQLMA